MKKFLVILVLALMGFNGKAQIKNGELVIDLGSGFQNQVISFKSSKTVTVSRIVILNRFINVPYLLVINHTTGMLEPLNTGVTGASQSACTDLEKLFDEVSKIAHKASPDVTEKVLKAKLVALKARTGGCTDQNLLDKIAVLIKNCSDTIDPPMPYNLAQGDSLLINIAREEGIEPKEYKYSIANSIQRRWVLNYGFAFTPKSFEPNRYFLESLGSDSFKLNKKSKLEVTDMRYTPALFFSYYLDKNLNKPWNHSLSGGLGFNTATPVVFVGYNAMYNQNIGIGLGICMYEQEKLNGKYEIGQIITENLEDAQLYEKHFRPNVFLSIHFRLGKNPFEEKKQ